MCDYFEFGPVVQETLFKRCFYLEIWWPLHWVEQEHFSNFRRGHYGQHSCDFDCLMLNVPVNSYGHDGKDSSPNHILFLGKLD